MWYITWYIIYLAYITSHSDMSKSNRDMNMTRNINLYHLVMFLGEYISISYTPQVFTLYQTLVPTTEVLPLLAVLINTEPQNTASTGSFRGIYTEPRNPESTPRMSGAEPWGTARTRSTPPEFGPLVLSSYCEYTPSTKANTLSVTLGYVLVFTAAAAVFSV